MGKSKKEASPAYEVRLSDHALKHIDEIAGYIAFVNHQPLIAEKVVDHLFDTFDRIGKNPFAFKECAVIPTKTKMYRQAVCYKWLIIYRISGKNILVIGIIHGSRRPKEIKVLRKVS